MMITHLLRAIRAFGSVGLALAAGTAALAQSVPFTVELHESPWHEAPTLQGFAVGQTVDGSGRWLVIGGRTTGLHGLQEAGDLPGPETNFKRLNGNVWVIKPPPNEFAISETLENLVPEFAESLAVTNAPSVQVDGKLYIVGGYGLLSDTEAADNATYDRLTIIDIDATADAIMFDEPLGNAIRQSEPHRFLQVTGGALGHLDGVFYLVFGQNFTGNYTEQGNGKYTHQVRAFSVFDDGVNPPTFEPVVTYGSEQDSPTFRRRDFNLAPARAPNGDLLLTVYGGVFTPDSGVWRKPVYIDPAMEAPFEEHDFEQRMCQYECGVLPMRQGSTMYTIFFGGISESYYDVKEERFVRDRAAPFISQVTCIRRDANEWSREFVLTDGGPTDPLQLPALLGASARFIPIQDANLYTDGILDLDLPLEKTLVGYLYGGIRATKPNGNFGVSFASDLIFEVHLYDERSPAIAVEAP